METNLSLAALYYFMYTGVAGIAFSADFNIINEVTGSLAMYAVSQPPFCKKVIIQIDRLPNTLRGLHQADLHFKDMIGVKDSPQIPQELENHLYGQSPGYWCKVNSNGEIVEDGQL